VAPPLKLRPLNASQRSKGDQVVKQLSFKQGDRPAVNRSIFQDVYFVGSALGSVVGEPGVDSNGLIVIDVTIRFRMPETRYLENQDDFVVLDANGGSRQMEPSYTGPIASESWRLFVRIDQKDLVPERIQSLSNDNPLGYRGFCDEIIKSQLKGMDLHK